MPHLRIETNVPKSKIPADFVIKAVPVLAKSLGKPEQYCVVSVIPEVPMSFAGTTEPCAIANVMSIGALGVEQNKKHAKALFALVEKELGVKNDSHILEIHLQPVSITDLLTVVIYLTLLPYNKFQIPTDLQMYITFQDEPTGNVGFKGTTFHEIFG